MQSARTAPPTDARAHPDSPSAPTEATRRKCHLRREIRRYTPHAVEDQCTGAGGDTVGFRGQDSQPRCALPCLVEWVNVRCLDLKVVHAPRTGRPRPSVDDIDEATSAVYGRTQPEYPSKVDEGVLRLRSASARLRRRR